MNIRPTQTLTVIDPREFEGDPYQVAERAIQQTRALTALVLDSLDAVNLMARNAELERQLSMGTNAEALREAAAVWPESPQGRRIERLREALLAVADDLPGLEKAVAFNPRGAVGGRRASS